jgi:hypothetical protein
MFRHFIAAAHGSAARYVAFDDVKAAFLVGVALPVLQAARPITRAGVLVGPLANSPAVLIVVTDGTISIGADVLAADAKSADHFLAGVVGNQISPRPAAGRARRRRGGVGVVVIIIVGPKPPELRLSLLAQTGGAEGVAAPQGARIFQDVLADGADEAVVGRLQEEGGGESHGCTSVE